ncbi:roadblock/LC7 domain-containing protein [Oculatella sp. FACHB-28]|nr:MULTISPECIES: roadblock/LC7 domain-containing protein [Cyanophyceae]MBD1867127.1 roadblock/LC7 domain-containing protein [Cyanobacteria bacterium FACHB-471]MBD2000820.1 roadblock/LC7 domain-containing protein [Leptolyngbya sp. FACHB-541]MBD2059232.1 roadblock/LC7 domain-containing protein [Oculatella sp. FACHB-28]
MAINTERLGLILQNFVSATSDVQGAALVTPDGLPLVANLPGAMDEERVSAMSAAMLSLGERIGKELARGTIDRLYVEGDEGFSILTSCGQDAVFLVLAGKTAKQGVLMLEIKRAVSDLRSTLFNVGQPRPESSIGMMSRARSARA